jgi:hypothetical protein
MTIADKSGRTGTLPAFISKLERNQAVAELETLFSLVRILGHSASEILVLAESRTAPVQTGSGFMTIEGELGSELPT